MTQSDLNNIARLTYEIVAGDSARVYDRSGRPMYTRWEELSEATRDQTIAGLKTRVEREGLEGYFERKRSTAGDALTNRLLAALRQAGYLPAFVTFSHGGGRLGESARLAEGLSKDPATRAREAEAAYQEAMRLKRGLKP